MADIRIVGGDQNNRPIIAATVRSLNESNPLDVISVGPSGEQLNFKSSQANYGRVNVGTSTTLIIASNPNRVGLLVQNLERQQMFLGLSSNLTVMQAGGILKPSSSGSSGDGGVFSVTDYTGPVYGMTVSGDVDVFYQEYIR